MEPIDEIRAIEEMRASGVRVEVVAKSDSGLASWEHERIIIHRSTIRDILHLDDKDRANMLLLYCFYYEKGRQDGTNQPHITDTYIMDKKGLGWSKDLFYRIKKKLIKQGYIKSVPRKDEGGKVVK